MLINVFDKNKNGTVSFYEFIETLKVYKFIYIYQ